MSELGSSSVYGRWAEVSTGLTDASGSRGHSNSFAAVVMMTRKTESQVLTLVGSGGGRGALFGGGRPSASARRSSSSQAALCRGVGSRGEVSTRAFQASTCGAFRRVRKTSPKAGTRWRSSARAHLPTDWLLLSSPASAFRSKSDAAYSLKRVFAGSGPAVPSRRLSTSRAIVASAVARSAPGRLRVNSRRRPLAGSVTLRCRK
ncbi:MAG TPA: hypothetical protein VFS43_09650 [Polyangiaceae bacterium]|nr:hypothetical protein [Polyangiaceae bacterium]